MKKRYLEKSEKEGERNDISKRVRKKEKKRYLEKEREKEGEETISRKE